MNRATWCLLWVGLLFQPALLAESRARVRGLSEEEATLPSAPPQEGMVIESSWWRAERYRYSLGYEGATGGTILSQNALSLGRWTGDWGFEVYFGYTNGADSATGTTNDVTNTIGNTRTVTTTYTGTASGNTFLIGGALKRRLVQSSWFQLYLAGVVAVVPGANADYRTGSRAEATPDTTTPSTRTITETSYGTVTVGRNTLVALGPKIGTEFYLKWFPHLAVGFSTGILASFGGDTVTTTTTANRTIPVVGDVEQTPTASTSTTTVATQDQGLRGSTFGVGGTTFSFTGVFTIRYIW